MKITMISNLLPHEERHVFFLEKSDVVDVSLLSMMNDETLMKRGALWALLDILALDTLDLLHLGLKT
jgi:hypothetical protein